MLTVHARTRLQQRGIPPAALERLLDEGSEAHDHRGAVVLYFRGRTRKRLEGRSRRLYAVFSTDGDLITVGHRRKRVRHD